MRGDRKIKTLRKWAKATLHRFHFVFAPQGKTDVLPGTGGAKAKCQNLSGKSKMGKNKIFPDKYS
jgi:hypothetical protein